MRFQERAEKSIGEAMIKYLTAQFGNYLKQNKVDVKEFSFGAFVLHSFPKCHEQEDDTSCGFFVLNWIIKFKERINFSELIFFCFGSLGICEPPKNL